MKQLNQRHRAQVRSAMEIQSLSLILSMSKNRQTLSQRYIYTYNNYNLRIFHSLPVLFLSDRIYIQMVRKSQAMTFNLLKETLTHQLRWRILHHPWKSQSLLLFAQTNDKRQICKIFKLRSIRRDVCSVPYCILSAQTRSTVYIIKCTLLELFCEAEKPFALS